MQITKLTISNFRSFGPKSTKITLNNLSAIIGSNSSGKTTLIQALLKLFGQNQHERILNKNDFHVSPNTDINLIDKLDLIIEARIDFPELQKGTGNEGKKTIPPFLNQMVINGPQEPPYLRIRLQGNWIQGNTPDGDIDQKLYYVTVAEGEDEKDALLPVPLHHRTAIQMIYVPAIREPMSQLKNASGTILWRILNNVHWPENIDDQIESCMKPIDNLFNDIQGVNTIKQIVGQEWKKYHKDFRYQNASIEFSSTNLATILKKIEIQFSPIEHGGKYTIDKLGDGLRSLFYLSLVSSLLEIEHQVLDDQPAVLRILAVEEPENHIAPHLLGRVMENLKDISKRDNAQVIVSSHSTSIVKRVEPQDIKHLRVNNQGHTIVHDIKLPTKKTEEHKYIKEAIKAYPELYFSKLVILGEGDSEEIVLPGILEANNIFPDDFGISIVPLGGRYVNHMWRLLNQLDIPHITLLDLDRERGGGAWGRIKYVLNQLIENGYDSTEVLKIKYGGRSHILSQSELKNLHKKRMNINYLDKWIKGLEKYNIFFSQPMDLDFSMLKSFPTAYKETAPRGPSIPNKETNPKEYNKKIKAAIHGALKSEKAKGNTYSEQDKELMIWYNNLFLGRGKPSTHIHAINNIPKEELLENSPTELKNLTNRVKQILEIQ
ncbi:AAA family ATPase [Bacillus cereus]|uniref:ATP-dependent nuclease n=1 Tax=Bacillus cereus TaxID=1396 RepID=UPI0027D329B1|nr:AAA family ATPase [Bacillus cereus]MCU5147871.1 AAA family ATPase [Bacillus cereus]MCU5493598.1 AAA family ATPase [Bacillus cereus]MCU5702385.1 AAA family ATPase [Bacillus cereus]MCU5767003.1 AAA family ATPase [Bacillus cereus]HDR6998320.1 AAA family ATPase [Bacillus cereus]